MKKRKAFHVDPLIANRDSCGSVWEAFRFTRIN